ncbi:hypothetical protein IWW38_003486 [Coemansia aciculifera]|uniref:Uncharacterized protein n=1 Tax=Coemansia aciculifera TaxID=417176 RepID=A0ACC1M084_9FUNG|nr:hypothetical protein IWW38_003486 [Coemansia aciculifera]
MAAGPNTLLSIQLILRFGLYASMFRVPPCDEWIGSGNNVSATEPNVFTVAEALTRNVPALANSGIVDGLDSLLPNKVSMQRSLVLAAHLYQYHGILVRNKMRTVVMT